MRECHSRSASSRSTSQTSPASSHLASSNICWNSQTWVTVKPIACKSRARSGPQGAQCCFRQNAIKCFSQVTLNASTRSDHIFGPQQMETTRKDRQISAAPLQRTTLKKVPTLHLDMARRPVSTRPSKVCPDTRMPTSP